MPDDWLFLMIYVGCEMNEWMIYTCWKWKWKWSDLLLDVMWWNECGGVYIWCTTLNCAYCSCDDDDSGFWLVLVVERTIFLMCIPKKWCLSSRSAAALSTSYYIYAIMVSDQVSISNVMNDWFIQCCHGCVVGSVVWKFISSNQVWGGWTDLFEVCNEPQFAFASLTQLWKNKMRATGVSL